MILMRRRTGYYRRYPVFPVLGALVRAAGWLMLVAVLAGVLVAGWPLTVAAAWAYVAAWAAGWPPRRLVVAATWCLPMIAAFVIASLVAGDRSWDAAAWSPLDAWVRASHALAAGAWLRAMVVIAPTAIPLGLLAGAGVWRARIALIASGAAGWSPGAAVAFDERQWRRSVRTASLRVRAPGGVPLLSSRGDPQIGAVIRSVGSPAPPGAGGPVRRGALASAGGRHDRGWQDHDAGPSDSGVLGGGGAAGARHGGAGAVGGGDRREGRV